MSKIVDFDLPVNLCGIQFRNPFYVSSGPTTMTVEQLERIRDTGWGGASLKLTVHPLPYINRVPRYGFYPDQNLLTFTAEKRLLLDELLRLIELGKRRTPELVLFANITYAGDEGPDGWVEMAKKCEAAGVDIIELNMCCPNMSFNVELSGKDSGGPKTGASMGKNEAVAENVVAAVRKAIGIPLFLKLTPEGGRIADIALSAFKAGADAVGGTANRLGIPPINLDDPTRSQYYLQKEVGMACLSGGWIKPLGLRDVYEMRRKVGPDHILTGVGGITTWQDAIEMAMCGADLVGICAATIVHGFGFMPAFIEGARNYMREKGYNSFRDLRDLLVPAIRSAPELTIYEGHASFKALRPAAPCVTACPNSVPAQGYVCRVAEERFEEAYQLIMSRSPLQSICGKVCDHPCEQQCTRGSKDQPIMIRAIKRFVLDMAAREGWRPDILDARAPAHGTPVAVVGAGPAGLAAAYDLARAGYAVTVMEAERSVGGMLRHGIPAFRLASDDIDAEISVLNDLGVRFKTGLRLGRDFSVADLKRDGFKAIFLGLGAQQGVMPDLPDTAGDDVWNAVDFLHRVRNDETPAMGRRVAVIGGGFTAVDAARTARRLGAEEVTILYRRTRDEMPACDEEIAEAEEEDVRVMYLTAPVAVRRNDSGRVTGLRMTHYVLHQHKDASGRKRPVEVADTEFTLPVDSVIFAVGQRTACGDDAIVESNGVIQADPQTGATPTVGVFAGGDCVLGPQNVISAIAMGKRAAVAIDAYLAGKKAFLKSDPDTIETDKEAALARNGHKPRAWRPEPAARPAAERVRDFDEYLPVLTRDEAVQEASRCLACGCGAGCEICSSLCKMFAYRVDENGRMVLDEDKCVACGMCLHRCPNKTLEMVQVMDAPM